VKTREKRLAVVAFIVAAISILAVLWQYAWRPLSIDEVLERRGRVGDVRDVEGTVTNVIQLNTTYGRVTIVGLASATRTGGSCEGQHLAAPAGTSPRVGEKFRTTLRFSSFSLNGDPAVWSPTLLCPFPLPWAAMGVVADAVALVGGISLRFNGTDGEGWTTYSILTSNGDRYHPERIPVALKQGRGIMTEEIKRAVEEKGYEASIWITLASVSYVELSGGFDRAPELDTMESLALRNSTGGRLQYIDRDADGWVGSGDALRVWIPGTSRDGAYETYLVSLGGFMNNSAYAGGWKFVFNGPRGPYEMFPPTPEIVQLSHVGDAIGGTVISTIEVATVELGPPKPLSTYRIDLCRDRNDCLARELNVTVGTFPLPGNVTSTFSDADGDGLLSAGDRFVVSGLSNRTRVSLTVRGPDDVQAGHLDWITGYGHVAGGLPSFRSSVSPGPPYTFAITEGWWHPALGLGGPLAINLWENSTLVLENVTVPSGTQRAFPNGTLSFTDGDADGMFTSGDSFLLQGQAGTRYRLEVTALWSHVIYRVEAG